jgi:ArsR family transcriptional regulator, virulence genes transcriptional regulator
MDVKRFNLAAGAASDFVKSLAQPVRLRIICALATQECSVTMLADSAGVSMSTISRHLALLRKDHIVKARRARQTILYSLSDANVAKLIGILSETFCCVEDEPAPRRKQA